MQFPLRDVRTAIDKSGYVLELRLLPKLERAGFHATCDEQFQDLDTGKSREIDVYAWRRVDMNERDVKHKEATFVLSDLLQVHLILECKSSSTPLVLFSRPNRLRMYGRSLFGGFPKMVWDWDKQIGEMIGLLYEQVLDFDNFHSHHGVPYISTRFGKLISKRTGGTVEWGLDHAGIYPSVEKLCRAAGSTHNNRKRDARDLDTPHTDQFQLHMTYPILVVAGTVLECRVSEHSYTVRPAEQLFLDWNVRSASLEGSYRICVVTERALPKYLKAISRDIDGVVAALSRSEATLRDAVRLEKEHPDAAAKMAHDA